MPPRQVDTIRAVLLRVAAGTGGFRAGLLICSFCMGIVCLKLLHLGSLSFQLDMKGCIFVLICPAMQSTLLAECLFCNIDSHTTASTASLLLPLMCPTVKSTLLAE